MAPEKEKITTMILYVDLKCTCCYKKVRKLLCKFPQIRDQVFDVDKNKVTITVVCCDPERLRDKLCCKGGGAIQSIEIVKKKPPEPKPEPEPKPPPKPRPQPQTHAISGEDHHPPQPQPQPQSDRYQWMVTTHHNSNPKLQLQPQPRPQPMPMDGYQEYYEGWDGGPFHYGYGRFVPPPPSYDYYGYQYPSNRPCYVSRCDYFSEDNPQGCSIM